MIRATTPTHEFVLPFDYEQFVGKILITYSQDDEIVVEKTENDIAIVGNSISIKLTQEETAVFKPNKYVKVQVRILTLGGEALASDIISKPVCDVLNDEVLK